ncbi:MAG: 4Fe-4S binding protein [Candidatus Omnitrophica bacterium]|nr:4Fe-4S binding protein [Candidatus Omnitrophota bacterium]
MRYPKLRELKEAIIALVKGPYTSLFPLKPHIPYERFRGRPEYHEEDCIGCGACFQVCPAKAIEMKDEGNKRTLIVHWDLCIFCGQCQANCVTAKGIMLSNVFDLATTEKRQDLKQEIAKELLFCACCHELLGPRDQVLWVAQRLGPLTFSNASLMLFYLQNLSLAAQATGSSETSQELQRSDRIRVLCPRCRREAVIKS